MPSLSLSEAYAALGVSSNSTEAQVRTAYKKLALKLHPDKNPGNAEAHKNFLKISEAYKRITDPDSFPSDEDENGDMSEEEMMSMFNMMFGGGSSGGMMEMMAAMMMMGGDFGDFEDDNLDESSFEDILRAVAFEERSCSSRNQPKSIRRKGKLSKKQAESGRSSKKSSTKPAVDEEVDCWETDTDDSNEDGTESPKVAAATDRNRKKASMVDFDEDFDVNDSAMFEMMIGAMGMDMMEILEAMDGRSSSKRGGTTKSKSKRVSAPISMPSNSSPEPTAFCRSDIEVGDRVFVSGRSTGRVAFIGEVHYAKGIFVGVIMDDKSYGKNNGVVKGVEYFSCQGNSGIITRISEVTKQS